MLWSGLVTDLGGFAVRQGLATITARARTREILAPAELTDWHSDSPR